MVAQFRERVPGNDERGVRRVYAVSQRSTVPDAEDPWLGQYSMIIRPRHCVQILYGNVTLIPVAVFWSIRISSRSINLLVLVLSLCLRFARRSHPLLFVLRIPSSPRSSGPVALVWIAFLRESPFFSRFSERDVVLLLISVERGVFVAVLHSILCRSFLILVLRITRNFSCSQLVFVGSHNSRCYRRYTLMVLSL